MYVVRLGYVTQQETGGAYPGVFGGARSAVSSHMLSPTGYLSKVDPIKSDYAAPSGTSSKDKSSFSLGSWHSYWARLYTTLYSLSTSILVQSYPHVPLFQVILSIGLPL